MNRKNQVKVGVEMQMPLGIDVEEAEDNELKEVEVEKDNEEAEEAPITRIYIPGGLEKEGAKDNMENNGNLDRVTTEFIMETIDELDNDLVEILRGHAEFDKNNVTSYMQRQNTHFKKLEKGGSKTELAYLTKKRSPKADKIWYVFFLILFILCYALGLYIITTITNYNQHWLAYASILYFLATLSVALDWNEQLLDFISFWENCWNVPKVAVRVNVKWSTGDKKHERKDRKRAKKQILRLTKKFMGWDKCCSMLRHNIRSKIEDQSIVFSALIDQDRDQIQIETFTDSLQKEDYYNCKVLGSKVLENVTFERRAPHLFMFLFFIFALTDYILLKITDEEDGYEVPRAVIILADVVVFYVAILLMIMALLSNWTRFSFACSEKAYIQGMLNISIIGFFVLTISRILRPPFKTEKNKVQDISAITWHKYHDWNKQVEGVVLTVVILWVMLVLFFVISVAAFAEFANAAADWGVGPALSCFIGFAMIVMLSPPAPGNIIDVFGGFLVVMVLIKDDSETWSFLSATAVAFFMVVALHYTGACFQWMMGKLPFAQQWMNRTFPIEMLATSDAVLGDANWFKVGLVGFVFLDTANGLNQGRIEMEFWTQLLSEWGAFPNGLCLVTFGATLALNGVSCEEDESTGCLTGNFNWTSQAIPLLFIMSGITQILGTTLGAGALAGSLDTDKYIMSREKWYIVHRMMGVGYIPTKKGWEEDVYELASAKPPRDPYFKKACELQHEWLEKRKKCETPGEVTEASENFKHNKWIPLRYQDHIKYLLRKAINMEKNYKDKFDELFRRKEKTELIKVGMWDDVQKNKPKKIVQCVLVVILIVCFYFGILGFYMSLDLEIAVKEGLDFLRGIDIYYWISAYVFVFVSCIYYFDSVKRSFLGIFKGIIYFIKCCPVDEAIETGFLTPVWAAPAKFSL